MVKSISFHSFKGGTGKTTLATNFAVLNASKGKKVCLLDFDFRAPSLHALFKIEPNLWLNDFLNNKCKVSDAIYEVSTGNKGKLVVGFADPSPTAMRDMMTKDRGWEAKALHRILSAKDAIAEEGFDILIFDTSPGIQYSSVNALACSNTIVLVMNKDELVRQDIMNVVKQLYGRFDRKIGVVLNKVMLSLPGERSKGVEELEEGTDYLAKIVDQKLNCPFWGLIPCFCEVLNEGEVVFALHKPQHPMVTELSFVAERILEKS